MEATEKWTTIYLYFMVRFNAFTYCNSCLDHQCNCLLISFGVTLFSYNLRQNYFNAVERVLSPYSTRPLIHFSNLVISDLNDFHPTWITCFGGVHPPTSHIQPLREWLQGIAMERDILNHIFLDHFRTLLILIHFREFSLKCTALCSSGSHCHQSFRFPRGWGQHSYV